MLASGLPGRCELVDGSLLASPSSRAVDLHLKSSLYAECGIGSYWVLDPDARRVHRFRSAGEGTGRLDDVDLTGWADA